MIRDQHERSQRSFRNAGAAGVSVRGPIPEATAQATFSNAGAGSSSLLRRGEPVAGSGREELEGANGRPAASRYLLTKIADGEIAEVFFFE